MHYPIPVHHRPAYSQCTSARFPIRDAIAAQCLSPPMYAELIETLMQRVVSGTRQALRGAPSPRMPVAAPA